MEHIIRDIFNSLKFGPNILLVSAAPVRFASAIVENEPVVPMIDLTFVVIITYKKKLLPTLIIMEYDDDITIKRSLLDHVKLHMTMRRN